MNCALRMAVLLPFLALAVPSAEAAETPADRAKRLAKKIDDLWRGDSSNGTSAMHVKTANYERTLRLQGWTKGKRSLIKVLEPKSEEGTSTLKLDKEAYTFLPKTDRTIRLTSGMMLSSWMGSHFTNDDIVRESTLSESYTQQITFEGERDGEKIIELTLTPKPDAPVVWAKMVTTIRASDELPIKHFYYDESGKLARTALFSDVKVLGGRKLPSIMKIIPADKPLEFTQLTYSQLDFDKPMSDDFFSLGSLRRR